MDEETAKAKAEAMGITVKEDAGRGWRQVVASPIPKRIVEFDAVRDLVEDGTWSCPPAAAGCRSSRPRTATSGPPRSSTRTAPAPSWPPSSARHADHPDRRGEGVHQLQHARAGADLRDDRVPGPRVHRPGPVRPRLDAPEGRACIEYVEAYPEGKALITSLECAAAGLRGETGTVIVAD